MGLPTPPHQRNKVEESLGFVASVLEKVGDVSGDSRGVRGATCDVVLDSDVACALAELAAIRVDKERHMGEFWRSEAEGSVESEVFWGRGKPFL